MATKTDICNMALQRLGAQRINDITDDNPRAKRLRDIYDICRDSVLAQGQWTFAKKRSVLAATGSTPAFEWTQTFTLPTDYITASKEYNTYDYKIEGSSILTNQTTFQFVYIFQETNEGNFSPLFVKALAWEIAEATCYSFTQNNALQDRIRVEKEDFINTARAVDSQSETAEHFDIDEDFIDFRT